MSNLTTDGGLFLISVEYWDNNFNYVNYMAQNISIPFKLTFWLCNILTDLHQIVLKFANDPLTVF